MSDDEKKAVREMINMALWMPGDVDRSICRQLVCAAFPAEHAAEIYLIFEELWPEPKGCQCPN